MLKEHSKKWQHIPNTQRTYID